MDADKEIFKLKTVELLTHLHQHGWIESYFIGPKGPLIRWTDKGERRAAALRAMDHDLTLSESYWSILLSLVNTFDPQAGRKILDP